MHRAGANTANRVRNSAQHGERRSRGRSLLGISVVCLVETMSTKDCCARNSEIFRRKLEDLVLVDIASFQRIPLLQTTGHQGEQKGQTQAYESFAAARGFREEHWKKT